MADRTGLAMIGLMLVAATIFVMTVGGVVVSEHLNGQPYVDGGLSMARLPAVAR